MQASVPRDNCQDRPARGRGSQRPCDFCRVRKTRCQMQSGQPCLRCQKAGRACTFQGPTRRHRKHSITSSQSPIAGVTPSDQAPLVGLRPEPLQVNWLQSLPHNDETTSASLSLPSPFSWDTFWQEADATSLQLADPGGSFSLPYPELITRGAHAPGPLWAPQSQNPQNDKDSLSQEILRLFPIESQNVLDETAPEKFSTLDDPSEHYVSILGLSAELDASLRARYVFDEGGSFRAGLRTFHRTSVDSRRNSMFLITPNIVAERIADALTPSPNEAVLSQFDPYKPNLRTLFDRFVPPIYPVPINHCPDALKHPSLSSSAVAAMIYTRALTWRTHDSKLPWSRYEGSFKRASPPDTAQVHSFVWQCISRDIYGPSYATIVACLLFVERTKPATHFCETSFDSCLMASLVTMSFTLGLNRDPELWDLVTGEAKEHRKWVWWLVYVQERWKCAVMGLRPTIREDDFDTPRPVLRASVVGLRDSQLLESIHTVDAMVSDTHFELLLSLTDILDLILRDLIAWKAAAALATSIDHALHTALNLQEKLTTWRTTMLQALSQLEKLSSDTVHFGNLKIAYIYCHILIYRIILRVTHGHGSYARIYTEAVAFLDLVEEDLNTLSLVHFSLFWFSWSRAQFNTLTDFLVLLYVSAPKEQKAEVRAKVEKHRHWLWIHSNHMVHIHMTSVSLVRLDSLLSATDGSMLK